MSQKEQAYKAFQEGVKHALEFVAESTENPENTTKNLMDKAKELQEALEDS